MSQIPYWITRPLIWAAGLTAAALLTIAAVIAIVVAFAWPQLPDLGAIIDYRPKIPLRIYTADGHLIGEFGEERRDVIRIRDVPERIKNAILAAEDDRFYQHSGIDFTGVIRAALSNIRGGAKQGASTITMQVARNFFLSSERTFTRKLYEALLALKIESNLSKDEILEVYINQIYLGQRAYGFAAAARTYFGKALEDLSLGQTAVLAGLPKAPSAYNPVVNPKRAKQRQMYVLARMRALNFIDDASLTQAQNESITTAGVDAARQANIVEGHAAYVAEMARQIAYERFRETTYTSGLRVVTTLLFAEQEAAYAGLRKAVMDYDRRHGYRGAHAYVALDGTNGADDETLAELLADFEDSDNLHAAIVQEANPKQVRVWLRNGETVVISGTGLSFAAAMLKDNAPANRKLRRGAVVYLEKNSKEGWRISQMPEAEAAFVAASPIDGAVRALVGGFDFSRSAFNHVTQAWRQPGSSFKPFIYSAALEKGFNPATIISDTPIVLPAAQTGSQVWEPHNYDGKYEGPISMREALVRSKNMVSIRILQSIGAPYAQDYASRFGFDPEKHPPYLTMALGAGSVTPWQQLAAYAVFANGGYRITPYIVSQITDAQGEILASAKPSVAGDEALRVIDARNAWVMDSMMRDVASRGTGARADKALGRYDLAGKTGTTNDYVDAWFCGYQQDVVGIAWIGFDQPKRLGNGETGGVAALPIWIDYMKQALAKTPETFAPRPEGLVETATFGPNGEAGRKDFIYAEALPPASIEHALSPDLPLQDNIPLPSYQVPPTPSTDLWPLPADIKLPNPNLPAIPSGAPNPPLSASTRPATPTTAAGKSTSPFPNIPEWR